jgi:dTDP-L-rhamnose 4-epimerase
VYGPRMANGMLGAFRSALRNGDAPRVFEDGRQLRDFVHVRDVARATLLALADTPPGTYNVASGTPRTVKALADALSRAFGGAEPLVTRSWRAGDVRHRFGETTAAAERLGFHAAEDFEAGMRECV